MMMRLPVALPMPVLTAAPFPLFSGWWTTLTPFFFHALRMSPVPSLEPSFTAMISLTTPGTLAAMTFLRTAPRLFSSLYAGMMMESFSILLRPLPDLKKY